MIQSWKREWKTKSLSISTFSSDQQILKWCWVWKDSHLPDEKCQNSDCLCTPVSDMHCSTVFPYPLILDMGDRLVLCTNWTVLISCTWSQMLRLDYSGCGLGVRVLHTCQTLVWRPSDKFCSPGLSIPHYCIKVGKYLWNAILTTVSMK